MKCKSRAKVSNMSAGEEKTGCSSWSSSSDRIMKDNDEKISGRQNLTNFTWIKRKLREEDALAIRSAASDFFLSSSSCEKLLVVSFYPDVMMRPENIMSLRQFPSERSPAERTQARQDERMK